jgi:hypothetical protein
MKVLGEAWHAFKPVEDQMADWTTTQPLIVTKTQD